MGPSATAFRQGAALASLLAGAFLPPLDYFIVNLALPSIQRGLNASDGQVQMIVSVYALAYAVMLITAGRLGDLHGRKRVFLLGMAAFTGASALCGGAASGTALVLGRVVQGLGAAMITPQVLATIRTVFPAQAQARLMGIYGFVFGLSSVAGQIGGGALIELHPWGLGWRAIFLINLPIGVLSCLGVWRWVPENRPAHGARIDLPGMALLTLGMGLLIHPLIRGRELGWPMWTIASLMLCLPTLLLFVRVERLAVRAGRDPLVDPALIRRPAVGTGLALAFLFYSIAVFFLAYGIFLQQGLGWSPLQAGLGIAPYGAGYVLGPLATPWLARRLGDRVLSLGLGLLTGGFAVVVWRLGTVTRPDPVIMAALFIAGVGQGIALPSLQRIVLAQVPAPQAGLTAGAIVATLYLGAAFAAASIGGVFFSRLEGGGGPVTYAKALQLALALMVGLLSGAFMLGLRLSQNPEARTGRPVQRPWT